MSCSRVIIEQRLADLELALKRQEELITSQRDAIRNLRDLIALDQTNSVNSIDVANNSMTVPHLHNGHLYISSNNSNVSLTSLNAPAAPMSLPRPSGHNSIPHPHDVNSPATIASASMILSSTNSLLGQRGYSSFMTDSNVQVEQHKSSPDASSSSFLTQPTHTSGGKRARFETSNANISQISRNAVVSAPVVPPLKRRRALEKIRQISSLFPILKSSSETGNMISAASMTFSATAPPPPPQSTHPIAAWRKPNVAGSNAQVEKFNSQNPLLPNTSATVAGQDLKGATSTQVVTREEKASHFSAPTETSTGDSFNTTTTGAANATNIRASTSNNNLVAVGDTTKPSITSNTSEPTNKFPVRKDIPIFNLVNDATVDSTVAANAGAPLAATHTVPPTVVSSAMPTSGSSAINNSSLNENSNQNKINSMDSNLNHNPANQIIHKQSNSWLTQMNSLNSASLRAKADFLVSLPNRFRMDGGSMNMRKWLLDGGKQQCFVWLQRLEEDNNELPIDGITLLEAILNAFANHVSYSKEEVVETRIDKLLRRIYKKFSGQKLSLGQQLLDNIRLLWTDYRTLYKEASGDDGTD